MHFDRFDIVEAYWCYFCGWHGGMLTEEYARLSKMSTYFKPAVNLCAFSLEENGKEIYLALVRKHQGEEAYNEERKELNDAT